jgi:isoamylase
VPMLLAGDELGRTQRGNNNAYCQDHEISWVDWEAAAADTSLLDFTCQLIALRREHPVFRRRRFFSGRPAIAAGTPGDGLRDISWLTPAGTEMTVDDWRTGYARSLGVLLNGDAITEPDPRGEVITDDSFLLLINAHDQPVRFTVPGTELADGWQVVVDTAAPVEHVPAGNGNSAGRVIPAAGPATMSGDTLLSAASTREVAGRAVVVLRALSN